jgi:hypothetical protein
MDTLRAEILGHAERVSVVSLLHTLQNPKLDQAFTSLVEIDEERFKKMVDLVCVLGDMDLSDESILNDVLNPVIFADLMVCAVLDLDKEPYRVRELIMALSKIRWVSGYKHELNCELLIRVHHQHLLEELGPDLSGD